MTQEEIELLSANSLFDRQAKLQHESDLILKELKVLETLNKCGSPFVVGAKKMGLMAKKDIDIVCPVENFNIETWISACGDFLRTKHIRRITPINYIDYDKKGCLASDNKDAFSYYISFNKLCLPFINESMDWEVQIHLMQKPGVESLKRAEEIISKLTNEKRELILRIKYFVKDVLKCVEGEKRIDSSFIYDAVLNKNVKSIEEFENTIKTIYPAL